MSRLKKGNWLYNNTKCWQNVFQFVPSLLPLLFTRQFKDIVQFYKLGTSQRMRGHLFTFTYCNQWKIESLNKLKLRKYVKFKTCFKIEDYVMSFMSRRQRSYLAQLRCCILPLHIEMEKIEYVKPVIITK